MVQHWHSERGWSTPELEAKYIRQDNSPDKMTDKDILEKVLGRQSVHLFGWGRSPSNFRTCTSEESNRPTYNQLVEDLNKYKSLFQELQGDVNMLRQVLIEKNIMPSLLHMFHQIMIQDDLASAHLASTHLALAIPFNLLNKILVTRFELFEWRYDFMFVL